MNSYYGNYRTRMFAEIFPDFETFETFYNECGIPHNLLTGDDYVNYSLEVIYYLLIANYANDHIKASDENRFKLKLMSIIYEAGPQWQRAMYLQNEILNLSNTELMTGSKAIYNHAMHPDTAPGTDETQLLSYIDDQNVTHYVKDRIATLINAMDAMETEICERFMRRFKKLFNAVVYPDYPLLYVSREDLLEDD